MSNRENVIVLGAGRGQIPLIDLFHKYNKNVYVVSKEGNYPGFKKADGALYVDIREKEEVLKFAIEKNIVAILTDQLDESVPTAAYVAEKMGLNGIGYDTALKFTNKFIMREEADKAGINVPKNTIISAKDNIYEKISNFKMPLMIKPVDSAASRGVYKVNNLDELEEKFNESIAYSFSKQVIVEEFIRGNEYVVEAFTKDYVVTNLVVGHRDYFRVPNTFIPNATVFLDANSALSNLENRLKEINIKLIKALGLKYGITHAEYLYDSIDDKIYLVEIAARGGGVFISSDLIPLACGINANELLVKEALQLENNFEIKLKQGSSAYFCYLTPRGKVIELEGIKDVEKINGVHKAFFDNIYVGMLTDDIDNKSSRKGPILTFGRNKEECYKIIEKVKDKLNIKVETKKGIEDVLWN